MIIGYARVSTTDQNLDLQLDDLTKAGCEKIYEDRASGTLASRPGLDDALKHLRQGDTLVVWKLDRLGRKVRQLVSLVGDLGERGVEFKSIKDGIDTSTSYGRLFFHVMAALAEMERDMIRERTMAGLTAARARGRVGGRRPTLTPDQVDAAKRLMADPTESAARVAAMFGVSRSTVYRAIAEPANAALVGSGTARQPRTA